MHSNYLQPPHGKARNPSWLILPSPVLFQHGNGIGDAVIRLSPNKDPQKLTGSEWLSRDAQGDDVVLQQTTLTRERSQINWCSISQLAKHLGKKYYKAENKRSLFYNTCHSLTKLLCLKVKVKNIQKLFKHPGIEKDGHYLWICGFHGFSHCNWSDHNILTSLLRWQTDKRDFDQKLKQC